MEMAANHVKVLETENKEIKEELVSLKDEMAILRKETSKKHEMLESRLDAMAQENATLKKEVKVIKEMEEKRSEEIGGKKKEEAEEAEKKRKLAMQLNVDSPKPPKFMNTNFSFDKFNAAKFQVTSVNPCAYASFLFL